MSAAATIAFKNVGFGVSAGGQYVTISGKPEWVALLATAEGAGRHTRITAAKRTWHVSACVYRATPIRVTLTKTNCHRNEAAAEALAGLIEALDASARKGVVQ